MPRAKTPSAEGLRRRRIAAANRGRALSDEHKARIGEALRGRPKSEAHRAAVSASLRKRAELRRAASRADSLAPVFLPPILDGVEGA